MNRLRNVSVMLLVTIISAVVLYLQTELPSLAKAATNPLQPSACDSTAITVTPTVPVEVDDPTNLAHAANFAWNEFIALTWPAMAQGPISFPRGQAQTDGTYGSAGPTGQLVWETYRHRIEVFPGQDTPNGFDPNAPDYGFNAKPVYRYNGTFVGNDGLIPPYRGISNPDIPPFNNLDEVTQITLNAMYAGVVDPKRGGNQDTEQEEKILYEAKVNEPIYSYAVKPRTLDGKPYALYDTTNAITRQIKFNSEQYLKTGDGTTYPPPYLKLPASDPAANKVGAIEIKAAWRRINTRLEDPSKFYTAPVRYYVGKIELNQFGKEVPVIEGFIDSNDPTVNEVWGLVALHIIHKTPNAPSFVYATFSQNDNILDENGIPVEQPDGTTKPKYLKLAPFTPSLKIVASTPPSNNQKAQKIAGQANTNSPQLYYHNLNGKEVITNPDGSPYKGPVNVNRRLFPIPPTITAANRAAHAAIRKKNSAAVWLNYRLVNVQARPLDLDAIPNGEKPTYFLANEVVETNTSLQRFSGSLNSSDGTITDYKDGKKAINMYVEKGSDIIPFTMGGCMGCHGSQGQKMGGDFSVIMARGRITKPDIVQEDEEMSEALIRANTLMFYPKRVKP